MFSSNAKSSRSGAMLHIFEYNEAVIKMIIKGRSPTMRHVSRTHRLALDWLLDRIKLDTKNQLADTPTGNFTRDEWNNLLHICSTSAISALPGAPRQCRKGHRKEQEKKEWWQSQHRRWTCFRRLSQALQRRRVRVHRTARGYSEHPVKGLDVVDVDSEWPNNFQISVAHVPHLEKVYSN